MDFRSRILIVDDDISQLEQLEVGLGQNYLVSLAASGTQALDYLRTDHWVDLILLDVLMPGMDGYQTLDAIRALPHYQNTPVIFLTSLTEPEEEVRGLEQGADYVTKPYTPAVLKGRIERALRTAGCLNREKLEALPQPLSEIEYYAALLMVRGYSNEQIAKELNYALGSVKNLIVRIMNKLGIDSRKDMGQYRK